MKRMNRFNKSFIKIKPKESLDVTELTNDQRRNLSEMAEIYRQFNRTCEVLSDETRKRAEQFISSGFLK